MYNIIFVILKQMPFIPQKGEDVPKGGHAGQGAYTGLFVMPYFGPVISDLGLFWD